MPPDKAVYFGWYILRRPNTITGDSVASHGRGLALGGSAESELTYFLVGAGAWAGAGCVFTGCGFNPCSTELGPPRLLAYSDNVIEVIMNATADQVVAFERALAAPRGPKAV